MLDVSFDGREFHRKIYIMIYQAKGLISEYQPKYNSARAVYKERKKYVDEIDWNMLAVPPTGSSKVISSYLLNAPCNFGLCMR